MIQKLRTAFVLGTSKCFTCIIAYSGVYHIIEFKLCLIFTDRPWAWERFCSLVGFFEINAPLLGASPAQESMACQVVSLVLFALILIAMLSRAHRS